MSQGRDGNRPSWPGSPALCPTLSGNHIPSLPQLCEDDQKVIVSHLSPTRIWGLGLWIQMTGALLKHVNQLIMTNCRTHRVQGCGEDALPFRWILFRKKIIAIDITNRASSKHNCQLNWKLIRSSKHWRKPPFWGISLVCDLQLQSS